MNSIIKLILIIGTSLSILSATSAQDIKVYPTYEEFQADIINIKDDRIHVVNFWATWCGPCVTELPYFEELNSRLDPETHQLVLVTIDWGKNLERKVKPFVKKKGLKSKIVLLDDPKTNDWIDLVDPSWSGAIPITLFLTKEKKKFYEKEYHSLDELQGDLTKFERS